MVRTKVRTTIKLVETIQNPLLTRVGERFGLKQVRNKY